MPGTNMKKLRTTVTRTDMIPPGGPPYADNDRRSADIRHALGSWSIRKAKRGGKNFAAYSGILRRDRSPARRILRVHNGT